jgi:CPA1 family monovalent cation:H+ antiporter
VNTVISFTVPFVASLPAEALRGSGLVAAVAAGLVVGRRGPRVLRPQHRRSDEENWATVSLVLEGSVFLLMGLEIAGILDAAGGADVAARALGFAAIGLAGVIAVRTAFVIPLLGWLHLRSSRAPQARDRIERIRTRFEDGEADPVGRSSRWNRRFDREQFTRRIQSVLASIDYLAASPLGPREGVVVVWAGMRGAVTVAAAQTLPTGADGPPQRSLLVLIAFGVAAMSLLLQGGTLATLIRLLKPSTDDPAALVEERGRVLQLVRDSVEPVPAEEGESAKEHRMKELQASRDALLDARDLGVYDAGILGGALAAIDAEQITLDLQGGPKG